MGICDKLRAWCRAADADDILSYKTQRMVVIRDRKLGALNLLCMFGIVIFVVLQLVMNGTYLSMSQAKGSGRFSLRQPTSNCTVAERGENNTCVPCDPSDIGTECYDNFPNVGTLRYCTQSDLPFDKHKMICRFEEFASAGAVFQSSLLVATRGVELREEKACSADPEDPLYQGGTCDRVYDVVSTDQYYYAFVTNFSVFIYHSLESPITRTNSELTGALHVPNNDVLCEKTPDAMAKFPHGSLTDLAPCWIPPNRSDDGADVFFLHTILAACDVELDDWLYEESNSTVRDMGTSLIVNIEYSNWKPWEVMFSEAEPRYEYKITTLHNNSFENTEAIYDEYPKSRTVLNRWGTRLVAVQWGVVRQFSLMQLLITAATSLTLITITTVIVDLLSIYMMPNSDLYEDYKFMRTPDLSDVTEGRACATCDGDLREIKGGGFCGICADEVSGHVYRCERCQHDRCGNCLLKSTLSKPPKADLYSMAQSVYGDESGTVNYNNYCRMLGDFGSGTPHPLLYLDRNLYDRNPSNSLKTQLHGLNETERAAFRRFLRSRTPTSSHDIQTQPLLSTEC